MPTGESCNWRRESPARGPTRTYSIPPMKMAYFTFCKSAAYAPLLQKYEESCWQIGASGGVPVCSARFSALKRALQTARPLWRRLRQQDCMNTSSPMNVSRRPGGMAPLAFSERGAYTCHVQRKRNTPSWWGVSIIGRAGLEVGGPLLDRIRQPDHLSQSVPLSRDRRGCGSRTAPKNQAGRGP